MTRRGLRAAFLSVSLWAACLVSAIGLGHPVAQAQAPLVNPEGVRASDAERLRQALSRLDYRPDIAALAGIQSQAANAAGLPANIKAQADDLRTKAAQALDQRRLGEAARLLYRAIDAASGHDADAKAFAHSLTIEAATPVADPTQAFMILLRQAWPQATAAFSTFRS